MRKAIVLLRVSSAGQTKRGGSEEGYSIENQRRACWGKAEQLEADVLREFVAPAESASKGLYRALREAIELVKARGDIDYLIVYRLDRFARDELTNFSAMAELKIAGCQLVSVSENIDDTPQGMLLTGILTSINAFYSRDLARKVTEGRVMKARLGGTPVLAPLGYLNVRRWDGANDIREVVIDEERAPLIQWAFQAYATGEWPLAMLADELWDRGLRSRSTRSRPEKRVAVSTLHRILKNRYYIGFIIFKGVEYDGTHETFVDPGTFYRVQGVLDSHSGSGEKQWKHSHYLKGLLYCDECGSRMKFTKVTGKLGGKYDYYVCASRHNRQGCPSRYFAVQRVEHFVSNHYRREVALSAERVAELEPRLIAAFHGINAYREKEAQRHRDEIVKLESSRRRLVEGHLSNPKAIPLDVLEEKQGDLASRLTEAHARLAYAEGDIAMAEQGLRRARALLYDAASAWDNADNLTRRQWNRTFFDRLYISEGGIERSELSALYADILADELVADLDAYERNPKQSLARGSTFDHVVETVGIEPTSAIAYGTASTSVAGALFSPSARLAGGVAEGQPPGDVPGSARADLTG